MQGLSIKEKLEANMKEMGLGDNADQPKTSKPKNAVVIDSKTPQQNGKNVEPLLFVNGKLNKADNEYVNKNFFVHKGLYNDITAFCRGMDTAIFNYLLHLGLEALKQEKVYKNVDISEIETRYQ